MKRWLLACIVVSELLSSCGSPVPLPDRSDPGVQKEEARLTQLLETHDDFWPPQPRRCSERLLGQEGSTAYVWAYCEGPAMNAGDQLERPAGSGPLRIDGDVVSEPTDGGLYAEDVRGMFPAELAEVILDRDPRIFP